VIYYPTVMARYSLFVLKVPLNPKQTNKPCDVGHPQCTGRADICWTLDFLLMCIPFDLQWQNLAWNLHKEGKICSGSTTFQLRD